MGIEKAWSSRLSDEELGAILDKTFENLDPDSPDGEPQS